MQHPPPGGVSLSREDSHRKPVDQLFMSLLPPLPVPPHQFQHLGPRSSQRDPVARLQVLNPMVRFPETRVADPDPYPDRRRIQSGQWIRIRIRNPDPGGQKLPTKVEKKFKSSCFGVLDALF